MKTTEAKHIHKGFKSKETLYRNTIKLWKRKIHAVLDQPNNYSPWIKHITKDGKLVMDGNPIYSLIKKDQSEALKIVQEEAKSVNPYMHAWIEYFDEEKTGAHIPVLIISLELSEHTLEDSLFLIHEWFKTPEHSHFKQSIEKINEKYE